MRLACCCALLLLGCGGGNARTVSPEHVIRAEGLPPGYTSLGRLVASCRALEGFRATDCEPLASFDCSRPRLERVLAERAASASGDLLAGVSCGRDGRVLRCSATAARHDGPAPVSRPALDALARGPVPGPAVIERWDEPRAETSLVIRVDFEPAVRRFERRGRRGTDVAEHAALPVSHRELGTLTTRCDEDECSVRELRQGLRIAAGGLGASDLVGVRCFERRGERECVANLAAAEVEE